MTEEMCTSECGVCALCSATPVDLTRRSETDTEAPRWGWVGPQWGWLG